MELVMKYITKKNFILTTLLLLILFLSISTYYYYTSIRYFYADGIPNLEISRLKSDNKYNHFTITGQHIGHIGSIGKTIITSDKNTVNILLKRNLLQQDGNTYYRFNFIIPKNVSSITFGLDKQIIWAADKDKQ